MQAVVSHGIRTILPRWAAEFCKLARGIWQNFLWKTVGFSYDFNPCWAAV